MPKFASYLPPRGRLDRLDTNPGSHVCNIGPLTITWSRAFSLACGSGPKLILGLMVASAQRMHRFRTDDGDATTRSLNKLTPPIFCPESTLLVDGATWDRCYIYAVPRYLPAPDPRPLCPLRPITAYPRWFELVEAAVNEPPRNAALRRPAGC